MTKSPRKLSVRPEAQSKLSLWWAPLDIPASSLARLAGWLSQEERERADGYHDPLDRDRFMAARGWLRQLLASQLRCSPNEVRIVTAQNGKPGIESSDLKFSASRSAGMALFATSPIAEVGIDIERIRASADVDIDDITATFFSAKERAALTALPPEQRLAASFQCWTCKEAYGKGIGTGLSFPIQSIDVWSWNSRVAMVGEWTIHQVEVTPGFAAAVAGEALEGWFPTAPRRVEPRDPDPPPAII